MCAIIGWSGKLPVKVMSRLLIQAQSRGKDSTGVGFREPGKVVSYRQAIDATEFVKLNQPALSRARKALCGLAHTRRASPGMPIDERNAHPFLFEKHLFAHNGKIDNWEELKTSYVNYYITVLAENKENGVDLTTELREKYAKRVKYYSEAKTDSMILGTAIVDQDFTGVKGCMGLVWMKGNDVYVMRSAKELAAATLTWSYKTAPTKGEDADEPVGVEHTVTIAASTEEIINKAVDSIDNISTELVFYTVDENKRYRLAPHVLFDEGPVPVNKENHADAFTSEPVVKTTTTVAV